MRLVLDIAIIAAVAAPTLWLVLTLWAAVRWRRLRRHLEGFRKSGRYPHKGEG